MTVPSSSHTEMWGFLLYKIKKAIKNETVTNLTSKRETNKQ